MTVFNSQVAFDVDDGQETSDTTWLVDGHDSDGNRIGEAAGDTFDMGVRFRNVTIPPGATINSAVVSVFMKFFGGSSIVTRLQGFDEDNTAAFSSSDRPSQRTQTTALVDKTYTGGDYIDETYLALDDCSAIVQEIVDRGGWSSGNAIGFVLKDNGSPSADRWQFQDYGREPGNSAIITIDYTASVGGTLLPFITKYFRGLN